MIVFFRALARVRRALPVLRRGSVKPLCAGYGYIAYGRFDAESAVAVACNNTGRPMRLDLPLRDLGIPDGTEMVVRFVSTEAGYEADDAPAGTVRNGVLRFDAPVYSAAILTPV